MGWHQGYLWQDWDPYACLTPPLVPHLTKVRPCCHEPQGQFSIPSIPCRAKAASASPSASLPQSPSVPRQVLGCDPRQSQGTGDTTLWQGGTHSHSDMSPFLCPPCAGCSPLGRARGPQRRWGGGTGTAGRAVPARSWIWAGSRQLPRGTLQPGQKNRSPRALVSWATGLSRSQCREEPPAPPGSPPAARWKTTVHFVLSQATKRTGEIPNFSSGATVPVTLFRGWQAQIPSAPGVCSPRADSCPWKPPLAQANPKSVPVGLGTAPAGAGREAEEGARNYKSGSPGSTPHPTGEATGAEAT